LCVKGESRVAHVVGAAGQCGHAIRFSGNVLAFWRLAILPVIGFISFTLARPSVAQEASGPPEVVTHTDTALQHRVFNLRKQPRECTGNPFSGQLCWEVYPIAWESFNQEKKGIDLIINIWQDRPMRSFANADLAIIVDGDVIEMKDVQFQPGKKVFEGATATLHDPQLVQKLARGSEVWVVAQVNPPTKVKLTHEMLSSISAVYDTYNLLDETGGGARQLSRLGVVNQKLAQQIRQMRGYSNQWGSAGFGEPSCTSLHCLTQAKAMLNDMLQCGASIGTLLDEKISLLSATKQDPDISAQKDEAIQSREALEDSIRTTRLMVAGIDQKLAALK
jgi:hypothetical protein